MFNIQNRRYTGNKYKLMNWIEEIIDKNCKNCDSFFDVFAGTGSVTDYLINKYKRYILNDFLYSNEVIYNAFFLQEEYDMNKLNNYLFKYNNLKKIMDNYVSINYGDKYFSKKDAKKIGYIRENIENEFKKNRINFKEYSILLASLIYSLDKISNTVGHYEAFIKGKKIKDCFIFNLIRPKKLKKDQDVEIYRADSNVLSKRIKADIAFIDPPYNSRQYSRFYHVLETIVKWEDAELFGTALKPKEENMSDYCRNTAPKVFADLIKTLDTKYIVVTYNNTYNSKSTSSQNKITLEQIKEILEKKGKTKIFEKNYKAFNTGKTEFNDHKEFVFVTEACEKEDKKIIRSPFFYVGDKYKLMKQLQKLFPDNINNYIEPFVGGGSSFLNTKAKKYILNDLNSYIIKLHEEMLKHSKDSKKLIEKLYSIMDSYNLSCSYRNITVSKELKQKYVKTYYSHFNKVAYNKMRRDFNKDKENLLLLYLLLIYGFNHMIRFNSSGEFNLPVGNVDFNKNVYEALSNYLDFIKNKDIEFYNMDYKNFLNGLEIEKGDYVFLDPPYLISSCEYNKMWSETKEKELFDLLDELDKNGVKFGITNLVYHKGNENTIFREWSKKYIVYDIDSNYISFNDNTIKINSKEVFVTNYDKNRS